MDTPSQSDNNEKPLDSNEPSMPKTETEQPEPESESSEIFIIPSQATSHETQKHQDLLPPPQIHDNDNLDVENENRTYSKDTLTRGQAFFKNRYIKSKLSKEENQIMLRSRMQNTTKKDPRRRRRSTDSDSVEITQKTMNTEKEARKYHSLFLKKVEKSIFSFNLKKYDDSYQELKSHGIIENTAEFGEFLLVMNGFDKYVIGEFLSKTKSPNNDGEVLEGFVRCIQMEKIIFVDTLRFLLSRLNLPKDANMILTIIDAFTLVYYEKNQALNHYKDSNAVYLLASSMLALNTMFTRTDIKTIKPMKEEEFIKMNEHVTTSVAQDNYNSLKQKPIDMTYNYNEQVYRRLSSLVEADMNKKSNNKSVDNTNEPGSTENKSLKEDEMLQKGEEFLKYESSGSPQKIFIFTDDKFTKLFKAKSGNNRHRTKAPSIELNEINDVFLGIQNSVVFQKRKIPAEEEITCITIVYGKNTLNLKHKSKEIASSWVKSLKIKIDNSKIEKEKAIEKEFRKESAVMKTNSYYIWKEEIIPFWKKYYKYIKANWREFTVLYSDYNPKAENIHINDIYAKIMTSEPDEPRMSQEEFYSVYQKGLPPKVRILVWPMIIGNACSINENLYNYYLSKIEQIHFDKIEEKYGEDLKNKKQFTLSSDFILDQMIKDIIKAKNFFAQDKDIPTNITQQQLMEDVFKIIRIFKLYRPDILYDKSLVYIAMLFVFNSENYFNSFLNFINVFVSSFLVNFFSKEELVIDNYTSFFEMLLETHLPKIKAHFDKLEITPCLYLVKWFETMYTKTFKYKTVLRIWDLFLVKGESVMFSVAIAFLKLQQDDLLNLPVSEVFRRLKRLPNKYRDEYLFSEMGDLDIERTFRKWKEENSLAQEKGVLFQIILNEEEGQNDISNS